MPLPDHLTLTIVTPDHAVVRREVDEVKAPGSEGSFGVLPGHTPFLASLQAGELWYRCGQDISHVAVSFGFAEVLPDSVTILADVAEPAETIDIHRAESARERARSRLDLPEPNLDFGRARVALRKSLVRLEVAKLAKSKA
ncbi:MAG: ATP synthase F1 subunit epsilon [Acidobacteria bacterium]|nr:ATP synthase F1 subunit epsilon [Acidobacteriota bacterium]|tara:strand:+ start:650 stop:1072 length:423 start_codon:yes stop_codon:yes gene_type:complete